MTLKTTQVGGAIVVREFFPGGERAWRLENARWTYCPDHKGPWLCQSLEEIPQRVRVAALAKIEEVFS